MAARAVAALEPPLRGWRGAVSEQLTIDGGAVPLERDELGSRQRLIHSERGKHSEDLRCDWCAKEGNAVLRALRDKGLVVHRRGGGWQALEDGRLETSIEHGDGGAARDPASSGPSLPSPSADRPVPLHAGAHDTERAAAELIRPKAGTARERVLEEIRHAGERGRTDYELAQALEMRQYTAAPRRCELVEMGWVVDSGKRRETDSGSPAIVWVLSPQGADYWEIPF